MGPEIFVYSYVCCCLLLTVYLGSLMGGGTGLGLVDIWPIVK